jgi:hypothetical protein
MPTLSGALFTTFSLYFDVFLCVFGFDLTIVCRRLVTFSLYFDAFMHVFCDIFLVVCCVSVWFYRRINHILQAFCCIFRRSTVHFGRVLVSSYLFLTACQHPFSCH